MTTTAHLFDYLKMFNYLILVDVALAAQLPAMEFDLSFTPQGDIAVNHVPFGVNVTQRYMELLSNVEEHNTES